MDKCLLIFMLILLCQSAYNLFAGSSIMDGYIDVIVRTSTASIFGYFLSINFIRHVAAPTDGTQSAPPQMPISSLPATPTAQIHIGFTDPATPPPAAQTGVVRTQAEPPTDVHASRLQILTAAGIGIFCLLVLLVLRNIPSLNAGMTTSSSATIIQFRDFVSGCIGFLIGCPSTAARP